MSRQYRLLSTVCKYGKNRTSISNVTLHNYVSTENMLPERGGIISASALPNTMTLPAYEQNDILLSNIRPYFKKIWFANKNGACSNDVLIIKANNDTDARFLYYVLSDCNFFNYSTVTAKGTKMPRGSKHAIMKYLVPKVDICTQRWIADILSAYDDLIENNNRRIALLEQAAQQIYREWFVRFRFPGHKSTKFVNGLPEGWKVKRLGSLVDFNPQTKSTRPISKSVPMAALSTSSGSIDTKYISLVDSASGSRFKNGDVLFARITPCLENGKTGYVDFLGKNEVACGSTEFIVLRSKSLSKYMVYFIARDAAFRQYAINSMNGADGRQRAREDALKRFYFTEPENSIIERFDRVVGDIFDEIRILMQKSHNLARQRDFLLPRLMGGKLEV